MSRDPESLDVKARLHAAEERLRFAEAAGGVGIFQLDVATNVWSWTPQIAVLFGFDAQDPAENDWEQAIVPADRPRVAAAIRIAKRRGRHEVEFRVVHPSGNIHWLAAKGEICGGNADGEHSLRGALYDITERKRLEARLRTLNGTLETRIGSLAEEARTLEVLHRVDIALAAELNLERLVQTVTDAGVELTAAKFGAFFHNMINEAADTYTLYTLSGAPREAFDGFPMPRNTAVFEPTFRHAAVVRSDDILADPRYGRSAPHYGMPTAHLPVRSYLAVPVTTRSGKVLGGLFFGHPEPGIFTDRAERLVTGLAVSAAIALDNARLYQTMLQEVEARKRTERQLQLVNETLEQRVEERARQLENTYERLTESDRRFRLLMSAVIDYAIFMLDPQGLVVEWNVGAERIKGYKAEEIIGKHYSTFYTQEDRDRGIPAIVLATASRTGRCEIEGWRVRKDGTRFWAGVVVDAIIESSGRLAGFAKITRDLTERQAAEERLRQSQKMEAIGQLTGGIAHDFNNMLTVISGNIETLQRRLPAGADASLTRLTTGAMNAASRAAVLTHRLLAFGRRQPLEPKVISINTLISGMSEMLRRTLGESIMIETVLAGGLWTTSVDANQMENAVLNLAINARDAMPDGGKLTIEVANVFLDEDYAKTADVAAGQYVGVFVSDTGTGMTLEIMSKAFDPFFTTKDVGQGTGLGLSQVYGFIKQSSGHVKIYSELGAGTTIKLYLPRHYASETAAEGQLAVSPVPRARSEMILVVEDDPDVRAHAVEILTELGYQVLEASDGAAGLRLLDTHNEIRLLFTDVGLPGGMNGRQLADEAVRRRPNLKVLFTSGYARNAIVHHGRLDPGVELIVKPFSFSALAIRLRRVLDGA